MHKATILLRKAVAETGIEGSVESRDLAISRFLGELQELFTERLINTLSAETLGGMFEDWLSSMGKLDYEERIKALALDVRLCAIPFTLYQRGFVDQRDLGEPEEPTENVVFLHSR